MVCTLVQRNRLRRLDAVRKTLRNFMRKTTSIKRKLQRSENTMDPVHTILRYLEEKAGKFKQTFQSNLLDTDYGARIHVDPEDEIVYLRKPLRGEYGEWLAVCRLYWTLKLTRGDIIYNPGNQKHRNAFFILPALYGEDADITDMIMGNFSEADMMSNKIQFCRWKFTINPKDVRWVACLGKLADSTRCYSIEFPGEEDGNHLRMDFRAWNESVCLVKYIYEIDGESIEEEWSKMWSEYKSWESLNIVDSKNPQSIADFISSRGNLNFIDLNEKTLTVESEIIQTWLDTLAPKGREDPLTDLKTETAIMIINNVVAQNLRDPAASYCCKTKIINVFDGSPDCEIKAYYAEAIKRITNSWTYSYQEMVKEKMKTRKVFWIDVWKESRLRARLTDTVFTPWSVAKPENTFLSGTKKYETNRVVNSFSGYRWNMDDLKRAYIDNSYADSVTKFEKLVQEGYCGKEKAFTEYFINCLAWIIQNPKEKSQVAIIIKGPKGLGKGWLARFLDMIWGKNYLFIPSKGLEGDFNSHLADRVMVFIDEINPQNMGKNNIDAIKSMITERNTIVHPKHQNQKVARSNINIIGATNNELTNIEMTTDNRRFFIVESPISQHEVSKWKPFIEQMWEEFIVGDDAKKNDWLRVRALFYYLVTKPLGDFVPHKKLPWTPYMKKMVEMSIPVVHNWWRFVVIRRQISQRDNKGSEPGHVIRKWYELFSEFKNCDDFSRLYDDNRRKASKLTQAQFTSYLSEVMVSSIERGTDKITVSCWQDQIGKWNSMYPYSAIDYDASDAINPMIASKISTMRSTIIDDTIKGLTREELEYALTVVQDECEEQGVIFRVNESFYKRTNDYDDLIIFENPNKKRKI